MKKNSFLKISTLLMSLMGLQNIALAEEFTCPQIEDFQHFGTYIIDYPLSRDINTQEYDSWLVAQFNFRKVHQHRLEALVISPVKPQGEESPFDASEKIISEFEPDFDNTPFHGDLNDDTEMYACTYTQRNTGAIANYIYLIAKNKQKLSAQDAMLAFSKFQQNHHR